MRIPAFLSVEVPAAKNKVVANQATGDDDRPNFN
jgi:hypothetical protein